MFNTHHLFMSWNWRINLMWVMSHTSHKTRLTIRIIGMSGECFAFYSKYILICKLEGPQSTCMSHASCVSDGTASH